MIKRQKDSKSGREEDKNTGRQKDCKTDLTLDLSEQAAHAGEALGLRVDGVALLEASQACEEATVGGDDEDNGKIDDNEDSDEIDDDIESVYSSLLSVSYGQQ